MEEKYTSVDRPVAISYILLSSLTSFSQRGSFCTIGIDGEWNLINSTIGSLKVEEKTEKTNSGMIFVTEVSALVPGHDDDVPEDILNISGQRVIYKVDYKSGKEKIIGDSVTGPRMFIDIESNTNTERKIRSTFKNRMPNLWLE